MFRLSANQILTISVVVSFTLISASPILDPRASISTLSAAQVSSFRPYSYYSAAGYCSAASTLAWECGVSCDSTRASFTPTASGGDGGTTQYWYAGFDKDLNTVIVSHQGTHDILPILTDLDFSLDDLDNSLFPSLSSSKGIQAHSGFANQQAITAETVMAAVKDTLAKFNTTSVTLVGHSSGAAISLLDSIYLRLQLPRSIKISFIGYSLPRVGNQAFADYVDSTLSGLVTHVNNREDIVPILPGRHLGFHHPSGEVHILDNGNWISCPGQDNANSQCTVGDVTSIFAGSSSYHKGPFDGVMISTSTCSS